MFIPAELLLGRMAVERGLLAPERLAEALRVQGAADPRVPLGVVLVELGLLSPAQVEALLCAQDDALGGSEAQAWALGRRVVQRKLASVEQVHRALREQARRADAGEPHAPLGALLVEQGALTGDRLAELLRESPAARAGDTPTMATAGGCEPGAPAPTRSGPGGAEPTAAILGPSAPALRRRFARYELLEELGRGGMGVVYRAFDTEMRREVALKTLLHSNPDPEARERLRREARATGVLEHPSIPPIYEVGEIEGLPYFAMAYVRGRPLSQVLCSGELGGPRERAQVVHQIAEAVAHAHERRVVHRDLKPGNVLIDAGGGVHVMDFGLAKQLDERTRLTATGQVLGTPAYMAPEQIEGAEGGIGPATDVYALGAVLYEALTGRPPFDGESPAQIMMDALLKDPVPPRALDRTIPGDLETICLKALAKEAKRRYPTARGFAEDLARYLEGRAIAARPAAWWEKAARGARRRKAPIGVAAVALAAAVFAGYARWEQRRSERQAHAAEEERRALELRVLAGLRSIAATNLKATLRLRQAGLSMREAERDFLPPLVEAVGRVAETAPGLAEPHYRLGRMYRALMEFDRAKEEQDRALAKEPDYAPSLYERGVYRAQKYRDRVQELREEWLRREGERLAQAGALGQARMGGEKARPIPPDDDLAQGDERARRLRADLRADLERFDRIASAEKMEECTAGMVACARGMSKIAGAGTQADRDEAQALFMTALEREAGLEEAVVGLANLLEAAGRYADAGSVYGRALAADLGYVPFWRGRGDVRFGWGFFKQNRGEDPGPVFADAIADYGKALELNPASAEACMRRGLVRTDWGVFKMNRGEDPGPVFAEAIADFGKALELNPAYAEAWRGRGGVRTNWGVFKMKRGEDPGPVFAEAIADFGKALELSPTYAEAWMRRGIVRTNWGVFKMNRGEDPGPLYADAIADYGKALALNPASAMAWMGRGLVRTNWGMFKMNRGEDPGPLSADAIADYGKALELNPASAEAWMSRGLVCANWGNYKQSLGEDPGPLYADAIADYGKALDLNPASAEAWMRRGIVRTNWGVFKMNRGEDPGPVYADAIADYGKALELNPASAEAWMRRGGVRTNWGVFKKDRGEDPGPVYADAIADYSEAVELNPAFAEAWMDRGGVRSNWGMFKMNRGEDPGPVYADAITDFGKALELNPASAEAWMGRGMVRTNWGLLEMDQGGNPGPVYADAIADYAKALELNPTHAGAWMSRGNVRTLWGNYQQSRGEDPGPVYADAIADYAKALGLNPAYAEAWMRRGWVRTHWGLLKMDRGEDPGPLYADAIADYGKALGLNPAYAEARWRRGWVYTAMARWADAVADFEAAIKLDPACEPNFRTQLAEARRNLQAGTIHAPAPTWLAALAAGDRAVQSGDYAAAGKAYADALAAAQVALDAPASRGATEAADPDRTRLLADPAVRQALLNAHYNLACIHSLRSAGKDGPRAEPKPIAPAEAARFRDRAFAHLESAVEFGWHDRRHLETDTDLAPLHPDPRWAGLLERLDRLPR